MKYGRLRRVEILWQGTIENTAAKTDGFENRKKLYDQALQIMAEEAPFMFLGSSYRRIGTRKNVSEFRMTPSLDTFDFRWTDVK